MAHFPLDPLLTIDGVVTILGRSRASIYRDIQRGEFPAALKLGGSSRWRAADVQAHIDTKVAERAAA